MSHTTIPVPKVLDWNADEHNPIGVEYIIMEHASGVQLHDVWPTMNSHQHMLVTKNLANAVTEMANMTLPAYGSLYFDAHINAQAKNIDVADGFVVGPNCGKEFWDYSGEESHCQNELLTNRGPCEYHFHLPFDSLIILLIERGRDYS